MNTSSIDLSSFRIILPPTRNISMSELRISPTKLIFSAVAVADLNYPKDICLLFSEEENRIIVSPSEKAKYTLPFLTDTNTQFGKSLSIGHTAMVKALRGHMKWSGNGTYRIAGIHIPDTFYLAFDLTTAICGRRKPTKMNPEKFLETCPTVAEIARATSYVPLAALPEAA